MDLPKEFLDLVNAVTAKRPRTVAQHILNHGQITTEELRDTYGYDHPPRARQDLVDQGIPVKTVKVRSERTGRMIAAYRFGDPSDVRSGRSGGRMAWPKGFKEKLVAVSGGGCTICLTDYEARYLQIDHRVPFQVSGDPKQPLLTDEFMLVCRSCNRAKSWSCEHCKNWVDDHLSSVCKTCYWASPDQYVHVALRVMRRLELTWTDNEVPDYDSLRRMSSHAQTDLPEYVKRVLRLHVNE